MKSFLPAILLSSTVLGTATAQTTPPQALLALSKGAHTLAIVDPSSLKVIARIPVGNDPHEVIASTDGSTAYVSNYGFGAYNTLAVIDLAAQKALPAIDLGPLRSPWPRICRWKGMVHCRGSEGHRQLRPSRRQSRLDHGHRPEPHPHDLRRARSEIHRDHQR